MNNKQLDLGLTDIDNIELSGRYNKKDKEIILKIMKVLKYWEDADIFNLKVKMMIAEHIHNEVKDVYRELVPRGLQNDMELGSKIRHFMSVVNEMLEKSEQEIFYEWEYI